MPATPLPRAPDFGDPVQLFTTLYCGAIALQMVLRFRTQLAFFRTSPWQRYGNPPHFLGLLRPPRLPEVTFLAAGICLILSLLGAAAGLYTRLCLLAALVSFQLYIPWVNDLSWVRKKVALIPLILFILLAVPQQAIWLTQLAVTMVYFESALEKLRSAGLNWADGTIFQAHLIRNYMYNERPLSLWLANRPGLCRLLSSVVLFWELTFVFAIFYPPLFWLYLPVGALFHTGTALALRIHYWIYFLPAWFAFIAPALAPALARSLNL